MELRRLTLCLTFFVIAVSQYSDCHSIQRRDANDDANYDYNTLADEAGDEDTFNDTDITAVSPPEKDPAIIETQPQNYKVNASEDLRLECKVSPDDGTVVQWYKNNQSYFFGKIKMQNDADSDRYSIAANSKDLIIRKTQASDSGSFKCEILQKAAVSITHNLLVLEKPKVIVTSSNGDGVIEGSEMFVTCRVTGSPVPSVMWSRTTINNSENNRLTEKDGEFYVNGTDYTLLIRYITREDAGKYYCYAINDIGNHEAEITVVVHPLPRVRVPKTEINTDVGIKAVLECSAHEEPRPHFRWYMNSKLIEDSSSDYRVSTNGAHSTLTVTPKTESDFGTFTCEAINIYGKHSRSIDLVESPILEDVQVEGAKISWKVYSHQPLEELEIEAKSVKEGGEGEWNRIQVPLPQGGRHEYKLNYVLTDKQLAPGNYSAVVKVKNSRGWRSFSAPVDVTVEEVKPQYIIASVISPSSAHSIRPVYSALSTIFMYLLVRML